MTETEFVRAVRRNEQRLYLIALSFTRSSQDAEDILQSTLMKLWKYSKPFESDEHLDKWLTRVTVNESKNLLKSPFRKRSEPLETLESMQIFDSPQDSDLFRAVMQLPPKFAEVVHLFYYEDYSVKQLADLLGISEVAAKTRLSRARTLLKETLGDEWNNDQ